MQNTDTSASPSFEIMTSRHLLAWLAEQKLSWHPRFLSKLAAEDRCHLNGLAMKDGRPACVTAVGERSRYPACANPWRWASRPIRFSAR